MAVMPGNNQDFISHELDGNHQYVVRFELYDTSDAVNYQFNVVSNDYSRGSVSGKDTTGADKTDQAQYESITSYPGPTSMPSLQGPRPAATSLITGRFRLYAVPGQAGTGLQ